MDAQKLLQTAYTGVIGRPPATPVKVPAGKSVWIVSCGQAVATCAAPAAGMSQAAKAIGWDAKVCDGQLNPAGWAACIRQGISTGADVITVGGLDCSSLSAPLQEARKAGIITVGVGGNNCDVDGSANGFTGITQKLPDMTSQQWYDEMGALQADWVIARTGGRAVVLSLQFTDTKFGAWVQMAFAKELATCPGCTIARTLPIRNQDVAGGTLSTAFSAALLQNPAINAVNVPLDGWFLAGLAQAVQSSGRSDTLSVIGAFGEPDSLALIRQGIGEDATVALNQNWEGWAGIDTALRLMDKQPVEPGGIGMQVVDKDTNMPPAGQPFAYDPAVKYSAAYSAAWGL